MTTGAAAVSGSITTSPITGLRAAAMKSRITGARAAVMKNRITGAREASRSVTGTDAAVILVNSICKESASVITANHTTITITTVMNTANARASLTISEAMKANIASLITAAGAGAARSEASSNAQATRSGPGSETRRPSGGGGRTRYVRGCMRGAARAVTGVPTNAYARTSTTV